MVASVRCVSAAIWLMGLSVSSTIAPAYSDSSFSMGPFALAGRCIIGKKYMRCSFQRTLVYVVSLVSGKVLCGGQQPLSIQCRGGNLSEKRFELRAAENWAGAPLPRFSTMRDAHRPVRFLRVDRPSPSPG